MKYWKILKGAAFFTLATGLFAGGAWGNGNKCDAPQHFLVQKSANPVVSMAKANITESSGVWTQHNNKDTGAGGPMPVYRPDPKVDCKNMVIKPNPSTDCKIRVFGQNRKDASTAQPVSPHANLPAAKAWNSFPCDTPSDSPGAKTETPDSGGPNNKQ